ncbi:MAG: hypothetical protein ACM3O7_09950 [Acidobacteriota bacterium]
MLACRLVIITATWLLALAERARWAVARGDRVPRSLLSALRGVLASPLASTLPALSFLGGIAALGVLWTAARLVGSVTSPWGLAAALLLLGALVLMQTWGRVPRVIAYSDDDRRPRPPALSPRVPAAPSARASAPVV